MAGNRAVGIVLTLAVGAVPAVGPAAEPTPPEPRAACGPSTSGWQASAQDLADELAGVTDPTADALREGLAASGFTAGAAAAAPARPVETAVDLGGGTGVDGSDPDAGDGPDGPDGPGAADVDAGPAAPSTVSGSTTEGPSTDDPGPPGGGSAGTPVPELARTRAVPPRSVPAAPAGPSARRWEELANGLARELGAAHDAAARDLADSLGGELTAADDPRAQDLADRLAGADGVVPMWERLADRVVETVRGILAAALDTAQRGRTGAEVPPARAAGPDGPAVPDDPGTRPSAVPTERGCDVVAAPGGAPGAGIVPPGAEPLFRSDFEDGFGAWSTCQNAFMNSGCEGVDGAGHALALVEDAREGRLAARFEVRSGDVPEFGGGERSEVAAHDGAMVTREGDERWYAFSLKFDERFRNPAGGDWFIVMQWHAGSGSPPLAIEVGPGGDVRFGGDGVDHEKTVIGPVRPGEWVDYVVHAGFSTSDGFVEAWENGDQTVRRSARATMSSDENYFKMGIYRGNDDPATAAVLFDGLTVWGPSGGGSGPGAVASEGAGSGGAEPGGVESGGVESGGVEPWVVEPEDDAAVDDRAADDDGAADEGGETGER